MKKYIFFIHGYSTNSKETWGNFAKILSENESLDYEIDFFDYKSPAKWQFWKTAPSLYNIAEGLITTLRNKCNLENDEIVLIGHSNGGVVIKKLLQRLSLRNIEHNISRVCFLDVPHHGSALAAAGSLINPRNQHIRSLHLNSVDLLEINDYWARDDMQSQLEVLNLVADDDDVVSSMSARFNIRESITIPNSNHGTIAKPESNGSDVVIEVTRFILEDAPLKKFRNRASKSYKDWLRIDRHHNLDYVADDARDKAYKSICTALSSAKPLVRLTGLSGLGKTRLLIEYIRQYDFPEDNILIFDASQDDREILDSISSAADSGCSGLVIIESCEAKFHDTIERILDPVSSQLKVVTIGFYHDQVNNSAHIKLEKLRSKEVLALISSILPNADKSEVERIERFVEGFPLLTAMITTQLLKDGSVSANFTERDLVEKLINGDDKLTDESRELLKVFSLFDFFPYQNGVHKGSEQPVEFIVKIAGVNKRVFDHTITQFSKKEIINCTGPFARLVPKPLALNLALEWWNSSLFERQSDLISGLPPFMLDSFCNQIKYLDGSKNVQNFVEDFLGESRPFGQAELLLSKKGSRLFRSLVEVNPQATSDALYRIIERSDDSIIEAIIGDVRRNYVWALEMLCFHKSCFEKSAWCLFKLACYESESYSNNSVGQFSQLFRWQLSGTEADFGQRLSVLYRALQLDEEKADLVVIEAIETAISTYGGTRTVGAEYQGTKPSMEEWRPKEWQEIFDYWQQLFNILLKLSEKPYALEAVKKTLGNRIRGLIGPGSVAMLDEIITAIIERHGKYWPSVSQAIFHALEYDKGDMHEKSLAALLKWKDLLTPDQNNLREKLTLVVLDPSRDYQEDESGQLVNVAGLEAMEFAKSFISVTDLIPYLGFILEFKEQKQSWVFGRELSLRLSREESHVLFSELIKCLLSKSNCKFDFVAGYLSGTYTLHESIWGEYVDVFSNDIQLRSYYPEAVRSGKCTIEQLKILIKFIKEGSLDFYSAILFGHGRVLDHLSEEDVSYFCIELSKTGPKATWAAFDILSMYMYGRENYDFKKLKNTLDFLLFNVSFHNDCKLKQHGGFHWLKAVDKLLIGDLDFSKKLLKFVVEQVISDDIDYSDLWDVFHPAFYKVFEQYGDEIWQEFSQEVLSITTPKHRYRIGELFGSAKEVRGNSNSIFTLVNEEKIIDWCENETALLMVAHSLKLFDLSGESRVPNPLLIRLVDKFGKNKKLFDEIRMNFNSRSWVGSIIPGLIEDREIIEPLLQHESQTVKQWANDFILMIDNDIEYNTKRESEDKFVRGY